MISGIVAMDFIIEPVFPENAEDIIRVMDAIAAEIDNRNIFIPDDGEEIRRRLNQGEFMLVARDNRECAGFLMIETTEDPARFLGTDLGWPPTEMPVSAHMDSVGVLPRYRGFGLQKRLLARAEEALVARGRTRFLATVSPENPPSLNSFLSLGYAIGATKTKYDGVLRHILHKTVPATGTNPGMD